MGARRSGWFGLVAAAVVLGGGCGDRTVADEPAGEAPPVATTTTSAAPATSTTAATSSTSTTSGAAAPEGGLDGEDAFVRSVVGATYAHAVAAGAEAHQSSDFGTKGSWTLFSVEHDGHWYAFTTKNTGGTLGDTSEVATGERLRDLPEGHWYGVSGIVRDGRPIGGVMLQGRGYDREADGTFPAVAAWRVNLQTLRLEDTSIAGLDVVESCG
jgi:hypothetical protein